MNAKSDSFKRLATARVNKAMNEIRLIGNLSNQANYEYSPEQVDAIFAALKTSLTECRKRFDLAMNAKDRSFHLD